MPLDGSYLRSITMFPAHRFSEDHDSGDNQKDRRDLNDDRRIGGSAEMAPLGRAITIHH